jgi:hypothetical protein
MDFSIAVIQQNRRHVDRSICLVQPREIDQLDLWPPGGRSTEVMVEPGATEQQQLRVRDIRPIGESGTQPSQPIQIRRRSRTAT